MDKSPSHSHSHSSTHSHSHSSSHSHSWAHHSSAHTSPTDVESHSLVDSLNPLEKHEQLHSVDSSVSVVIGLHCCIPDILVVHGRSDTHHQTEISITVEEFLSLQLSWHVHVVSLEDDFDVIFEHHVMDIGVPSSWVVDHLEAVHSLVVHSIVVAPSIESESSAT